MLLVLVPLEVVVLVLLVLVFIYFVILRDTVVTVAGYMVNGVIRGNTFLSAYTVYHCKKSEKCLLTVL